MDNSTRFPPSNVNQRSKNANKYLSLTFAILLQLYLSNISTATMHLLRARITPKTIFYPRQLGIIIVDNFMRSMILCGSRVEGRSFDVCVSNWRKAGIESRARGAHRISARTNRTERRMEAEEAHKDRHEAVRGRGGCQIFQ